MYAALSYVMDQFDWVDVAFLYTTSKDINAICSFFADTFEVSFYGFVAFLEYFWDFLKPNFVYIFGNL
jgi:hypothetical protein